MSWAAPDEPAPVWLDVAREYSEYWVHQQQIRDAVRRPGANSADLTAPVIDAFLRAVPYALGDVQASPGTRLEIAVTGPGGGAWTVQRGDTRWAIGRGEAPDQARVRIGVSADTLWRVATRGITCDAALTAASAAGDRALAAAALSLVSIIR